MGLPESVIETLAEAFRVPVEEVTPELSFGGLPQWDSVGHMDMLFSLERRFGVTIDASLVPRLTTVSAICDFLRASGRG